VRKLGAVLAAALFAASFAIVRPAWAGETLLGVILVTDGGSGTNFTAGIAATNGVMASSAATISATQCVTGFDVGGNRKITVQTDEGCFVCVNLSGADAGNCLSTAANEKLPTSTGDTRSLTSSAWNWDGGSQATPCVTTRYGGWVAVAPPLGGAACHAKVFGRTGTE
jgi:hypothetical protein